MFGDDSHRRHYETRDMSRDALHMPSFVGRGIKVMREEFGWSQAKFGVVIRPEEFDSKAGGSICELGLHDPPLATSRLIATALDVPVTYRYCENDNTA